MPRGGHSRTTRHGVEVQPGVRQHMGSGFLAIEADWTLFLLLACSLLVSFVDITNKPIDIPYTCT